MNLRHPFKITTSPANADRCMQTLNACFTKLLGIQMTRTSSTEPQCPTPCLERH